MFSQSSVAGRLRCVLLAFLAFSAYAVCATTRIRMRSANVFLLRASLTYYTLRAACSVFACRTIDMVSHSLRQSAIALALICLRVRNAIIRCRCATASSLCAARTQCMCVAQFPHWHSAWLFGGGGGNGDGHSVAAEQTYHTASMQATMPTMRCHPLHWECESRDWETCASIKCTSEPLSSIESFKRSPCQSEDVLFGHHFCSFSAVTCFGVSHPSNEVAVVAFHLDSCATIAWRSLIFCTLRELPSFQTQVNRSGYQFLARASESACAWYSAPSI